MNDEIKVQLHKLALLPEGVHLERKFRDVALMALQYMIEHSQARRVDSNALESPHLTSLLRQFAEVRQEATKLLPEFASILPPEDRLAVIEISKATVFEK